MKRTHDVAGGVGVDGKASNGVDVGAEAAHETIQVVCVHIAWGVSVDQL